MRASRVLIMLSLFVFSHSVFSQHEKGKLAEKSPSNYIKNRCSKDNWKQSNPIGERYFTQKNNPKFLKSLSSVPDSAQVYVAIRGYSSYDQIKKIFEDQGKPFSKRMEVLSQRSKFQRFYIVNTSSDDTIAYSMYDGLVLNVFLEVEKAGVWRVITYSNKKNYFCGNGFGSATLYPNRYTTVNVFASPIQYSFCETEELVEAKFRYRIIVDKLVAGQLTYEQKAIYSGSFNGFICPCQLRKAGLGMLHKIH